METAPWGKSTWGGSSSKGGKGKLERKTFYLEGGKKSKAHLARKNPISSSEEEGCHPDDWKGEKPTGRSPRDKGEERFVCRREEKVSWCRGKVNSRWPKE